MAEENRSNPSGMRPEMGDSTLTLPITFDYTGGRRTKERSRRTAAVIIAVLCFVIEIGILFGNAHWYYKILWVVGIFIVSTLVIRYPILGEKKIREEMQSIADRDDQLGSDVIWGIYSEDKNYPYICRFRNGKSGVYITLNKDVILGKYEESEYQHYEAIADAYNIAGAGKVQMIHIDYMDNIGTDDRLENSFNGLIGVQNKDLRDLLTDIFQYQQDQMMRRVTTFDTYLFMWSGRDAVAWPIVQRILACFLDANYRSYHVLTAIDLQRLTKTLFNLNDFSVLKANTNAFSDEKVTTITPIRLEHGDGSIEKLGKTKEERRKEAELKKQYEDARKKEKRRGKNKKKGKSNKRVNNKVNSGSSNQNIKNLY